MKENIKIEGVTDKSKKLKKWFKIIVLIALLVFVLGLVLNKFFWLSMVTNFQNKLLMRNIAREEQKYKDDKYGGKTPEETYTMFLEALKKKDIELASKYFVLDKQEQYKKALQEVDKGGKWDLMMEDLTNLESSEWRFSGNTMKTLELFDDKNVQVEQITFVLPTELLHPDDIISAIWKISEF